MISKKRKYMIMKSRVWTKRKIEDAKVIDGAWWVFYNGWRRLGDVLSENSRGLYIGLRNS